MVKGRPSLGVFTAEGGQFLGGHGMSDDAKTRTLTGLSKIYDTGSAQRVRAKEIVVVDGRRVSISLAAQAKIAASLLGDELAQDQGFLGRFLICYPDSRIGTREVRLAPADADPRVETFTDRVERLLYLQDGIKAPLRLPTLGLDAEAWEVFRAFSQAIEDNVGEGKHWHPVRATFTVNDEDFTKKMAAIALRAFEPADAVEGMLAAQAVALHYASLDCSRRAMLQGQPGEIASRLRKDAANSARAMVDMTEAIQRRRGKGPQVMRIERVIVNEGGQAVVGHVAAGAPLPATPPSPAAIGQGAPPMAMLDAVPVEVGEGVPHVRSID